MAETCLENRLLDRLPPVRGRYQEDASLSKLTWFGTGGPAEVLYRPADEEDLVRFMEGCPADIPIMVMGVGSNLLVRDGGIRGVVIRLSRGFARVRINGEFVVAGAAASDVNIAMTAAGSGVAGLEFLRGVPGSLGGALRMNAGAYGREISDVLVRAHAVDRKGNRITAGPEDFRFDYRHTEVPEDWIFTEACLRGECADPETIRAKLAEITEARESSQPVKEKTGGSTFKNPPGEKAWQLIDAVGGRGLRRGGAQISERHCNFLINTGTATSADLEGLGEEVRRRVKDRFGIELEWEIRRVGEHARPGEGEAA